MVRPSIFKSTIGLKFITITGCFFGIESIKRRGIKNEVICDEDDDDDEVESKRRRSNFRADLMLLHEKNELRKNAAAAALQNSDL